MQLCILNLSKIVRILHSGFSLVFFISMIFFFIYLGRTCAFFFYYFITTGVQSVFSFSPRSVVCSYIHAEEGVVTYSRSHIDCRHKFASCFITRRRRHRMYVYAYVQCMLYIYVCT